MLLAGNNGISTGLELEGMTASNEHSSMEGGILIPIVIYLNPHQDPRNRIWCPTCGEGCCQLLLDFDGTWCSCPGGCRHGEVHYLEQYQGEN